PASRQSSHRRAGSGEVVQTGVGHRVSGTTAGDGKGTADVYRERGGALDNSHRGSGDGSRDGAGNRGPGVSHGADVQEERVTNRLRPSRGSNRLPNNRAGANSLHGNAPEFARRCSLPLPEHHRERASARSLSPRKWLQQVWESNDRSIPTTRG